LTVVLGEYCGDCGMALKTGARCPRCGSRRPRPLPPDARWYCYNCAADVGSRRRACSQCGGQQLLPSGFEPTMRGMTALLREAEPRRSRSRVPVRSVGQAERMQAETLTVRQTERARASGRQSAVRRPKSSNAIWWVIIVLAGLWILATISESLTDGTADIQPGQAFMEKQRDYRESMARPMTENDWRLYAP
jgi:hypothetical protein